MAMEKPPFVHRLPTLIYQLRPTFTGDFSLPCLITRRNIIHGMKHRIVALFYPFGWALDGFGKMPRCYKGYRPSISENEVSIWRIHTWGWDGMGQYSSYILLWVVNIHPLQVLYPRDQAEVDVTSDQIIEVLGPHGMDQTGTAFVGHF